MSLPYLGENTPVPPTYRESPNDWGRGDRLQVNSPRIDRQVSFHYGSKPVASEMYDVTNLRRSNVRLNDQLVPKPTEFPIGYLQPNYRIPADHPYASHIERTSMFPDPSTTLTRSSSAIPLLDENRERAARNGGEDPSAPYEATFVEKARGNPWRREVVSSAIPASSLQPKSFADPYAYNFSVNRFEQGYPAGGMYPTPPSYQNPNSPLYRIQELGLSPRTSAAAQNMYRGDRLTSNSLQYTGNGPADPLIIDSTITPPVPQSSNEFTQPRPLSGRAASVGPSSRSRPIYCKAPNGEEFCNCWYCCEESALREHRFSIQQMEAENRLHLLNSQTPQANIIELRRKYAAAGVPKSGPSYQSQYLPQIFYNQMGTYLAERSGLYRPASYPVASEMGSQLYQQLPLQFYVKPSEYGQLTSAANNPFLKQAQVVQDGKRLQTDTDYGANYNTPTFLQENALKVGAKDDATSLMSGRNEDLRRVASMSSIPLAPDDSHIMERRGFNNPVTNPYLGGAIGQQASAWRPLCGVPWPHFNLAIYQNSFNRSAIHDDFHARFPERAPDLRENVSSGRRHDFEGFNAQELRGSLMPTPR